MGGGSAAALCVCRRCVLRPRPNSGHRALDPDSDRMGVGEWSVNGEMGECWDGDHITQHPLI